MKKSILDEFVDILNFLESHQDVKLPAITNDDLKLKKESLANRFKEVKQLEDELYTKRKKRDEELAEVNELIKRYKKLVVALFGSNSPELKAVGVVSQSEVKRGPKKSKEIKP